MEGENRMGENSCVRYKAINPLISDPAIDGVVINFLKLKGWVSKLTTYFQIL